MEDACSTILKICDNFQLQHLNIHSLFISKSIIIRYVYIHIKVFIKSSLKWNVSCFPCVNKTDRHWNQHRREYCQPSGDWTWSVTGQETTLNHTESLSETFGNQYWNTADDYICNNNDFSSLKIAWNIFRNIFHRVFVQHTQQPVVYLLLCFDVVMYQIKYHWLGNCMVVWIFLEWKWNVVEHSRRI